MIQRSRVIGFAALAIYAATVVLANWFIGHVGVTFGPGPHYIEVWPTIYAPSGVLWVGVALALRNLVQDQIGRKWAVAGVLFGSALSWWVADPALARASAVAFLASELLDMVVWTKLRKRGVVLAQSASNIASDVVDSICFLWLAFASLDHLSGQIIGKEEVTILVVLGLWYFKVGRYRVAKTAVA